MRKNLQNILLICISAFVLGGTLFFGLRPKGYDAHNAIRWNEEKGVLVFGKTSIAYTEPGLFEGLQEGGEFSIEMVIQPEYPDKPRFMFLFLVTEGNAENQMLLGLWDRSLVIMNGSDYGNVRREPKMYVHLRGDDEPVHVFLVARRDETAVFIDGELSKAAAVGISLPAGQSRLILGNNWQDDNPWTGSLFGLAVYDRSMEPDIIREHNRIWSNEKSFRSFLDDTPMFLYTMDQVDNHVIDEQVKGIYPLLLPAEKPMYRSEVLSFPRFTAVVVNSMVRDIIINIFGFIPCGLVVFLCLNRCMRSKKSWSIILSLIFIFLFSLTIELSQAWIPARNSSLLDLFLNTLGGSLGIIIVKKGFLI